MLYDTLSITTKLRLLTAFAGGRKCATNVISTTLVLHSGEGVHLVTYVHGGGTAQLYSGLDLPRSV